MLSVVVRHVLLKFINLVLQMGKFFKTRRTFELTLLIVEAQAELSHMTFSGRYPGVLLFNEAAQANDLIHQRGQEAF